MEFDFNEEKNDLLFQNRGISFYNVIEAIAENGILANIDHPNNEKYPNQKMFVILIEQYTYCVPYLIKGDKYFLKTIYPSRKFKFLLDEENHD